ncbi:DUF763 domain-containing protein, partial [Patescibacteria group bacterium]|nr:DUF763 domain-containing protein [Patescibacteria group bacterium]
FDRMVKLGSEVIEIIVAEYGPNEFIKRLGDPDWFKSLGTVLAFDWNASGLTTILTAALKEAVRRREKEFGLFICGGKGKASLKTPDEIRNYSGQIGLSVQKSDSLVYNSKMAAKVDSSLVQDGYAIYHHAFFFSNPPGGQGAWTVVQQGMNAGNQTARRYHWHSDTAADLVCEPHSGISSQLLAPTLDLTAKTSGKNRSISAELVSAGYYGLMKDIQILRKHSSGLSQMVKVKKKGQGELTLLNLETKEFKWHPVVNEDFSKSRYLDRILYKVCENKPENYEKLVALEGVGPKTIRALSLVAEMIYGAKPSYTDPARYSFAHGGKDATPYPVDRPTYDSTIEFFAKVIRMMKKTGPGEKNQILGRLNKI